MLEQVVEQIVGESFAQNRTPYPSRPVTNVENNGSVSSNVGGKGEFPYTADTQRAVKTLIELNIERGFGLNGALFLLDQENTVEPIWGTSSACLWSRGEPMYVFSSPNVGKTTVVQRLMLARAGIREAAFLGWPVEVDTKRILYVAADRPQQAARSWRRMVSEADREALEVSLVVWPQGLPFTLPTQPDQLVPWVKSFGEIGTVVLDSLFNVAPSLTDEEGAANTNNALQSLVRAGIEVIVLHHDRKRNSLERKRVTMDDMYGGRPITGGAGSVIYLDGDPGTGKFSLKLLKAPAGPVEGPKARIDFSAGEVNRA